MNDLDLIREALYLSPFTPPASRKVVVDAAIVAFERVVVELRAAAERAEQAKRLADKIQAALGDCTNAGNELLTRVAALEEALREARRDFIAVAYEGFDSTRRALIESAVDRIDAVLPPAEEETE